MGRLQTIEPLIPRRAFHLAISLLAIAAFLLVAACGNDDSTNGNGANGPTELTIVASDTLSFEPSELRVKVGEPVRVILDNREAGALHDFSIAHIPVEGVEEDGAAHGDHDAEEFAVHVAAAAGETGVVEFTPTEPGEYPFVCSVLGHELGGMAGLLIVE